MRIFTERIAIAIISFGALLFLALPFIYLWNERELNVSNLINDSKFSSYGSVLSGLVGTTWSLASVVLFYVVLREQRNDMAVNKSALELQTKALNQQVEEFEQQTEELAETRKIYIEQSKTQSLQRFENTFFQMLALHHNIVEALVVRPSTGVKPRQGRDCFQTICVLVQKEYGRTGADDLVGSYLTIYNKYQGVLGHYFRNLYHIFKFIDNSGVEKKKFYCSSVRAQLSSFELQVLFYNCLTENGKQKFKPLIEKFSTFKNIDFTKVLGGIDLVKKYNPSAYGYNDYSFYHITNTRLEDVN